MKWEFQIEILTPVIFDWFGKSNVKQVQLHY